MNDLDLDALAAELAEFAPAERNDGGSARKGRIIAGFEDIQRFVEEHGRVPQHGEDYDIFERLYAVRLDRLRAQSDCRELLAPLDSQGLLADVSPLPAGAPGLDDDALFAELGGDSDLADIATLRHVRSSAEKRASEEIANRIPCTDFVEFKPLFERVKGELAEGVRRTMPLQEKRLDAIRHGQWFVIGGQIAYVAEDSGSFETEYDRRDSRLRVIYDNGTESSVLARSLQRALHRDPASRIVTEPIVGPLFAETAEDGDVKTGTIYVLRSKSDDAFVAEHRSVLHKIGVTGNDLKQRVANAENDPTFLMARVDVVAQYKLYNIDRVKLENLIHRVFAPAQIDVAITDRFGKPVQPREWFLVPEFVVSEAVERIKNGTITDYIYDPQQARLVLAETTNVPPLKVVETIKYFAYGSNMSSARLRARTPSARAFAIGKIAGYRLVFHKRSNGSAKADAFFTGNEFDKVWGVVFQIDKREKGELDKAEGLHYGYEQKFVSVETETGNVTAVMYYATDVDPKLLPYSWYVRHAVVGAREHSLPEEYIKAIERVPQVEDPDKERDTMNRAIGSDPI